MVDVCFALPHIAGLTHAQMYNDDNDDDKDDNNGMGLYQLKRIQEDKSKSKPTLYWKLRLAGERKWGFKSYNINAVN